MMRCMPLIISLFLWSLPSGVWADALGASQPPPRILVNQVGYLPLLPKVALLMGAPSGVKKISIQLMEARTHRPVLDLTPGPPYENPQDNGLLRVIDFSRVRQTGRYYLAWKEIHSPPFQIQEGVFTEPLTLLLRSYTLQRCGVPLQDPLTGLFHGPCHMQDAMVAHKDAISPVGTRIPAHGGWHDAGDFGKYVATTAVTVGRLLSCWERDPDGLKGLSLSLPGPETPKGPCDVLTEIKVGITWMMRMQRRDGALYRKLSGARWTGPASPETDLQPRYIYGISTPETAKAAAAFAMAARVYAAADPAFARQCLRAARDAWDFLKKTPGMRVDQHPGDDTGSGIYLYSAFDTEPLLTTDIDDRFWAAAELFITTGEAPFLAEVTRILPRLSWGLFEWKDPSALGMADLIIHEKRQGPLVGALKTRALRRADTLLQQVGKSPWFTANTRLVWGSNKMTAEEGITLALAYDITGNPAYLSAALSQLNFLLGINPFAMSFVTGVGTHPVRHVNHLFARAVGRDIPGLLVGGPNENAEDGIAPKGQGLKSYIDDEGSYATNEYAIDYNAALIGLIVHLNVISQGEK